MLFITEHLFRVLEPKARIRLNPSMPLRLPHSILHHHIDHVSFEKRLYAVPYYKPLPLS